MRPRRSPGGVSWWPERVRVFDGEVGPEELVVLQQRPDDQVVDWENHTGPRRLEFPPYIAQRDLAGSYSMRAVGNDLPRGIRGPRDDRAAGGGPVHRQLRDHQYERGYWHHRHRSRHERVGLQTTMTLFTLHQASAITWGSS